MSGTDALVHIVTYKMIREFKVGRKAGFALANLRTAGSQFGMCVIRGRTLLERVTGALYYYGDVTGGSQKSVSTQALVFSTAGEADVIF